jgi:hypothetical protein
MHLRIPCMATEEISVIISVFMAAMAEAIRLCCGEERGDGFAERLYVEFEANVKLCN